MRISYSCLKYHVYQTTHSTHTRTNHTLGTCTSRAALFDNKRSQNIKRNLLMRAAPRRSHTCDQRHCNYTHTHTHAMPRRPFRLGGGIKTGSANQVPSSASSRACTRRGAEVKWDFYKARGTCASVDNSTRHCSPSGRVLSCIVDKRYKSRTNKNVNDNAPFARSMTMTFATKPQKRR